jgi:GH43 family beta-xylosidase
VLVASPAATRAVAAEPVFANPVIRQRADPHVFLHSDGYYYFMATVPEYDRLELRRARTLHELATAPAKVIWRKRAAGSMGAHVWAPEIHFIDGKWYVYFSAGAAESVWEIRLYVLENPSPNPLDGEWAVKGQIKTQWESFSLDATTFEHRGVRYLVWAQNEPPEKGTNLYLAKMATPWSIVLPQVRISRPEFEWEQQGHRVNEAPAVLRRNGRIFIAYSASATDANYCVGLLTAHESADLLHPRSWSKSPTPVFASSEANRVYGPGHNSFTTTAEGAHDLLVYHARSYREIEGDPLRDPNRHTRVQALSWKADGTPDFGVPVPDASAP